MTSQLPVPTQATSTTSPARRASRGGRALLRSTIAALALLAPVLSGCGGDAMEAADVTEGNGTTHAALQGGMPLVVADDAPAAPVGPPAEGAHAHHAATPLPAGPLPGASLYHLSSAWRAQDGSDLVLSDLRGDAIVMVMFYGDCTTACPLLVRMAEQIEAALPSAARARTQFVMVTFDTARDTPEKLRAYAAEKGLDRDAWHWLVGTPLQTRQLAAMLGVQYRDAGNGTFAHGNVVTVLDAAGVPTARLEGLGIDVAPAVQAVEGVLTQATTTAVALR